MVENLKHHIWYQRRFVFRYGMWSHQKLWFRGAAEATEMVAKPTTKCGSTNQTQGFNQQKNWGFNQPKLGFHQPKLGFHQPKLGLFIHKKDDSTIFNHWWSASFLQNVVIHWSTAPKWCRNSISWAADHPNWRTPSFFRGVGGSTTNQP